MIPVVANEADQLVEWKPLLLLNKSHLGSAFVHSIIACSPNHITSKSGKRLPVELWLDILDFATIKCETDLYTLVQPHYIRTNYNGDKDLVCRKIREWEAFGYLQDNDHFFAAEFFLAKPDRLLFSHDNPFGLPETRQYGLSVTIPIDMLACGTEFLYVKLTVPDVIKYLEDGDCRICRGGHTVGRGFCGAGIARRFLNLEARTGGKTLNMICPLCVGPVHAMDSLYIQAGEGGLKSSELYRAWEMQRLRQLGFVVGPVTLQMSLRWSLRVENKY
ncbi:hypothetical protein ACHAPJ_003789 [Fusarium lateritium]